MKVFRRFEQMKSFFIGGLTAKRGRYVQPFLHSSMSGIFLIGLALAPSITAAIPDKKLVMNDNGDTVTLQQSWDDQVSSLKTLVSVKPRDTILNYTVKSGDTLSSISKKFDVDENTIRWQNKLGESATIKVGDNLEIPPTTGVIYKVKRGDTIYSIAKNYSVDAQAIVNWPFNTYTDDETFGLAVGQTLIIPDGVMPQEKFIAPNAFVASKQTPNAGQVSPSGKFIWPTNGIITQYFKWYHQALDIANPAGPNVLAADSGTVVAAGWDPSGYGNKVVIDHGNGFRTLYGHHSAIYVKVGQTVNRGDLIGKMGNTGRSTGTHLHFEIILNGVHQDPIIYLQ